jgi:hypothetical protein
MFNSSDVALSQIIAEGGSLAKALAGPAADKISRLEDQNFKCNDLQGTKAGFWDNSIPLYSQSSVGIKSKVAVERKQRVWPIKMPSSTSR